MNHLASAKSLRVAAVQMCSSRNKEDNLEKAGYWIEQAASQGARLIVLPEYFSFRGGDNAAKIINAETIPGPTCRWGQEIARRVNAYILLGSILESDGNTIYNTAILIAPSGDLVAKYRKLHLFTARVGDVYYNEGAILSSGRDIVVAPVDQVQLGITICYDLRFPELYRALTFKGANIIAVPANFTLHTGKDHWEVLLRARAIENQIYVIAAAQAGMSEDGKASYGRSMVIDPWGIVISQASDREGVIIADIDLDLENNVRNKISALRHFRTDVFLLLREVPKAEN